MELREVRRFALTTLLLVIAIGVWTFLVYAQSEEAVDLRASRAALGMLGIGAWMAVSAGTVVLLVFLLSATVMAADQLPRGWLRGQVRQVQCDQCKAVFHLNDTGHRPINHMCPNCKTMGFYDGKADPIGETPISPRDVVKMALRCRNCANRFHVIDTGVRPLRITCPSCKAGGKVH